MPVLEQADQDRVVRQMMRVNKQACSWEKPELRAAEASVATGVQANRGTLNNLFPEPFRTKATARQKALMLALHFMAEARAAGQKGLLETEEDRGG